MDANTLYPKLSDHTDPDVVAAYKSDLEKQRLINFKNDLDYLKQQIGHYGKLYRRWKKIDTGLRYFSVAITGVSSIGGVIILSIVTGGIGSVFALPVSIALGSLAVGTNFIDGVLSKTLSSKRKKKYHELMKIFEQGKNELFLFQQKALIDGKLDDTELRISHEIVERCKNLRLKQSEQTATEVEVLKKQMNTIAESIRGLRTT